VKKPVWKTVLLCGALAICVFSAVSYIIRIQAGSANVSDIVILAVLITLLFFSFAFLTSISGVKLTSAGTTT
jgi:hypothetical protein